MANLPSRAAGSLGFYDRRTKTISPYYSWDGNNWINNRAGRAVSAGQETTDLLGPGGDYTAVGLPGSANAGWVFDWQAQAWVYSPGDGRTQAPTGETAYLAAAQRGGFQLDAGQRDALRAGGGDGINAGMLADLLDVLGGLWGAFSDPPPVPALDALEVKNFENSFKYLASLRAYKVRIDLINGVAGVAKQLLTSGGRLDVAKMIPAIKDFASSIITPPPLPTVASQAVLNKSPTQANFEALFGYIRDLTAWEGTVLKAEKLTDLVSRFIRV